MLSMKAEVYYPSLIMFKPIEGTLLCKEAEMIFWRSGTQNE